jgi:DNA-directed RNA polymerase specialized sigma24 family protein
MKQPDDQPHIRGLWVAIQVGSASTNGVSDPSPATIQQIMTRLQQLPEPLGRVIQLRYFDQQGIPTIALSIHCSKRTVRNFLDKGLHRLRKEFNPTYQEQLDTIKAKHTMPRL